MSPSFLLMLALSVGQTDPVRPAVILLPPVTTDEPPLRFYSPDNAPAKPGPSGPIVGNPPLTFSSPLPSPPALIPIAGRTDLVLRWNETARTAVRVDRTPPPVAARNLAIMSVAVCDSVGAVLGGQPPLVVDVRVAPSMAGDPVAAESAALAAAHKVLVSLYPEQATPLDDAYCKSLAELAAGPMRDAGLELGRRIACKALEWREADCQAMNGAPFVPRDGFGLWRPTPPELTPALLPNWTRVGPFAVRTDFQPKLKGPPPLSSPEYWSALNEVRALGSKSSVVRSPEQTEIANFWSDGIGTSTPVGHWNKIACDVAKSRGQSLADNARLFAMLNLSLADAGRVCWIIKFETQFWRPITAIRLIADRSTPNVPLDPNWEPLLPTPAFPSYTSGHSTFSGAAATALAKFYGTDEVRFESTSEGLPGVRRSYPGFWAAASEAGRSRIFGGIHYEFDNADGLGLGRTVAETVIDSAFRRQANPPHEAARRPLPLPK